MGKVFGFLLAVALTVSNANAALLLKYDFTNGTGGSGLTPVNHTDSSAEGVAGGVLDMGFNVSSGNSTSVGINPNATAAASGLDPAGTGVLTSRALVTSNSSIGTFQFDLGAGISASISKVVVRYRPQTAMTASNTMTWTLGGVDTQETIAGNVVANATSGTNYVVSSYTFATPVFFEAGNTQSWSLLATRTGTGNNRMLVDYIELYGDVVPEPTSMAIFGAMGLGLVARRFRKK
jgi:hypothetical protein